MEQCDSERIRALCERLATFIEANDSCGDGPIKPGEIGSSVFGEGHRCAWIVDRHGEKWELRLTRRVTTERPTGTDTIHEITIANILEHEMASKRGRFPRITLRLDTYPEHLNGQRYVRDALAVSTIPVRQKYWLQRQGRPTRVPLALDAWTPNDGDTIIVVEFDIAGVEAFAGELMHGTRVLNERILTLRRERDEHAARVMRAHRSVITLTAKERHALDGTLVSRGVLHRESEYWGMSMADTADWQQGAVTTMRNDLTIAAAERGAELIVMEPLQSEGGLVTAFMTQDAELFVWADRKAGMRRLAMMRGVASIVADLSPETAGVRADDVTILTRAEFAQAARDLEQVATLDASMWSISIGMPRNAHGHLMEHLKRQAAAIGGTMIVYDNQHGHVAGAAVYRTRTTALS